MSAINITIPSNNNGSVSTVTKKRKVAENDGDRLSLREEIEIMKKTLEKNEAKIGLLEQQNVYLVKQVEELKCLIPEQTVSSTVKKTANIPAPAPSFLRSLNVNPTYLYPIPVLTYFLISI